MQDYSTTPLLQYCCLAIDFSFWRLRSQILVLFICSYFGCRGNNIYSSCGICRVAKTLYPNFKRGLPVCPFVRQSYCVGPFEFLSDRLSSACHFVRLAIVFVCYPVRSMSMSKHVNGKIHKAQKKKLNNDRDSLQM